MSLAGYIICRKVASSPYACVCCRQRVAITTDGKIRLLEYHAKGQELAILCNACGAQMTDKLTADPNGHGIDLEILPHALKEIADRAPELAKELFRKEAKQRAEEAKAK